MRFIAEDMVQTEMETILGEFTEKAYTGNLKAIAICVVDETGNLRTRLCYKEGHKFALIAGTAVLHREMLEEMTVVTDSTSPE